MAADLHVLMTADAVGGVWSYSLDLARALQPHGVRTTLVTMGPRPQPRQLECAAAVPGLHVLSSDYKLEWMDDPWDDVAAAGEWLLGLERHLAPDVVHLNGYAHAALPWRAPALVVAHSCVASWAEAVPNSLAPAALARYIDSVGRGIRAAAAVVAPTRTMLDALGRIYGLIGRTAVIPNGRTDPRLVAGRKEPYLFTAGRLWDRAKNLETVTAVAPHLPWPLAIAGDARMSDGSKADATPALRGCRTLGRLTADEMADWLSRASILVLPARYEPFGLLPLEAALCGCALVLGDIPSLREVWGDAADFVPPDDAVALREALAQLIAAPARLNARAAAARSRAQAFTAGRMAAAYLQTYTQLLASPVGARRSSCAL